MDLGAQQGPSAPNVHMDTGAQQDALDSGAPASDAGTTEDAGTSDKSIGLDIKGKGPAMPEVRTTPEPASARQAAPAAPEQPAPKTPSSEKAPTPAKPAAVDGFGVARTRGTMRRTQGFEHRGLNV
jgi:hypothetical protein